MSTTTIELDIIIIGAGIAGLWSLARLRQAGFRVMLIEVNRLGGIQTLASQGIIHGGIKYALAGQLTNSAQAISAMPDIWRACLSGTGELDLTAVTVLAKQQYLWSTGSISSNLMSLLASRAMHSRVVAIQDRADYPGVLQNPRFSGYVYKLAEPVLDVSSLVLELTRLGGGVDACLLAPLQSLKLQTTNPLRLILADPDPGKNESGNSCFPRMLELHAKRLVLAAGAGNGPLLKALGYDYPVMQLRPLHMLMLRGPLPPIYGHCLGIGTSPRLTITSHPLSNGEWVWYLGGQIAEAGVKRTATAQIAAGRQELQSVLPWLDLTDTRWSSFRVDRAEPRQPSGLRPEAPFLSTHIFTPNAGVDAMTVMWPTKLAFAPALAAALLADLTSMGIKPTPDTADDDGATLGWPHPLPPLLPWQETAIWT